MGIFGSISGGLGILGLHNVCHTVCEGLIIFLALFGLTVVGMPLAFLQDYSLFFSIMGAISGSLGIIFYFWMRKNHKISRRQNFWFIFNIFIVLVSSYGIFGGLI